MSSTPSSISGGAQPPPLRSALKSGEEDGDRAAPSSAPLKGTSLLSLKLYRVMISLPLSFGAPLVFNLTPPTQVVSFRV